MPGVAFSAALDRRREESEAATEALARIEGRVADEGPDRAAALATFRTVGGRLAFPIFDAPKPSCRRASSWLSVPRDG